MVRHFSKTAKNSKFENRMELLDLRGFIFGIKVGGEFEKFWIKINNSRASAKIDWFLQKRECNYTC